MTTHPTVIVAGEPKLAEAVSRARHSFPHVLATESASGILGLASDSRVLEAEALCYVLSSKLELDVDNVSLDLIGSQLASAGHTVLVVGNTEEGRSLAEQRGWPLVKPRMNVVELIENTVNGGADEPAPVPTPPAPPASPPAPPAPPAAPRPPAAPPAAPAAPAAPPAPTPPAAPVPEPIEDAPAKDLDLGIREDLARGNRWGEAKYEAAHHKSRELAPVEGSSDNWGSAVSLARQRGDHETGGNARGYILVFAARKGGVGKTTLCVNSAAYMAEQLKGTGRRVCLVDMNFQQSDVGKYLGRERPNVTTLIRRPNLLQPDHIEDALVHDPQRNLWALLGPSSIGEGNPNQVNTALYRQIIEVLREKFDYIFIDTPVAERYHEVLDFALPTANFIVVPLTPNRVTIRSIREWLDEITKPRHAGGYGIEPTSLGLVLNKAKLYINCDPTDVEDAMSTYPWLGFLPDSDEWQAAENLGKLIGSDPGPELGEAFRQMLYRATRCPELKARVKKRVVETQKKAKLPWWKKILGQE